MTAAERFERLPTAAKLLLILTAVLLPIGIALAWVGEKGIGQANARLKGAMKTSARRRQSYREPDCTQCAGAEDCSQWRACRRQAAAPAIVLRRSLAIAPAVAQSFELESADGKPNCAVGEYRRHRDDAARRAGRHPRAHRPDGAFGRGPRGRHRGHGDRRAEARGAARRARSNAGESARSSCVDGERELPLIGSAPANGSDLRLIEWPFSNGNLVARVGVAQERITVTDRCCCCSRC